MYPFTHKVFSSFSLIWFTTAGVHFDSIADVFTEIQEQVFVIQQCF